ncbi:MAG TPA: hypothetical protein PLB25_19230 [Rhodoferax sp.]|nr:hypothetical protein [Rhodoferax sp.]
MRHLRAMPMGLLALLVAVSLGACAYLQHPRFGDYQQGERQTTNERSPHFADGVFHKLVTTPMLAGGGDSSLCPS